MSNVKLIIVAVVIVAVSVLASYLISPGVQTMVERVTEIGGSGGDFQTNWYRFGGVEHVAGAATIKTATTTPCRIQAPSATSTLVYHSIDFRSATGTGAVILDIAKTTNALSYATTTKIGTTYLLVVSTGVTIVGSSTPTAADITIFNPNDWLVFKVASTEGVGGYVPTGFCKAEWIVNGR